MLNTYRYPSFEYRRSAEQASAQTLCHPVVIIGAGPVGLSLALDCAARGLQVVVLDDNNTVSVGSRAVCYAKRTLEIWDRLGLGQKLAQQGIQWQVGKVFFRDEQADRKSTRLNSSH
jgi:3-(3-hydroxy-phenyl)propionate hydroxylase